MLYVCVCISVKGYEGQHKATIRNPSFRQGTMVTLCGVTRVSFGPSFLFTLYQ